MQGAEVLEADYVGEFLHEGGEAGWGGEVVSRCEAVAGVDADADSVVVFLRDLG